jgi:hypothetical protein
MAGDYVDPVGKIAAEDEARYANGAIRMAQSGGWLTPRFMGRLALDEPPLLYWLSGAGARIAGVSRLALRAPIALVCALALALVFLWAAELNGPLAGVCAALLLLGDHLWHVLGGMCMADGLLAAFVAGALYALFSDPSLESAGALWGFAGATTAGILTKGLAGAMPLGILGVYWLAARRSWRPSARRAVLAGSLALALAAPWFVYQWLAHGKWFWAEHASRIPGYGAGESLLLFYLSRISLADPILVAISLAALPALTQALRRREPAATLLAAWLAVGALAALVWQSRNVAYLLPTIPAMAILASSFGPFAKDQALRPGLVLALGALAAKALLPSAPWGISFAGGTIEPLAPVVANYCERSRGNELILVGLGDALYGAIEPLPRLRYADIGPLPHGGPDGLDFASMGIEVSAAQFATLPDWLPRFRARLREWGLDSSEPVATLILARDSSQLADVVRARPASDFLAPDWLRSALEPAASANHDLVEAGAGHFLLLSRQARARTAPPAWSCRM